MYASESLTDLEDRARASKGAKYAILLMGATGAGKSSFIAAATGLRVRIGHSLDPCLSPSQMSNFQANFERYQRHRGI